MAKNISILGSTGSIGVNTLRIVRTHPKRFNVVALAVHSSAKKVLEQAKEFKPKVVCLYNPEKAAWLAKELKPLKIRVVTGEEGLLEVSTLPQVDQVIVAIVGAIGLKPIFAAIKAKKSLGIANKEPLVIAGELLMNESAKHKVDIYPIDSEHSGLWQCLEGHQGKTVKKLILTSSGGPFRAYEGGLSTIKPKQALKHPKWKMGPKITIDSATLMNKGLEVIEAANLFKVPTDKIDVLIHPEAVIHAMIEFVDGSHLAHLGITDMRLPIQYALSYPERLDNHLPTLDFAKLKSFHFEKPNMKRFPCLALGYEASRQGGTVPAALNAANEVAVEAFLNGRLSFPGIAKTIEKVIKLHRVVKKPTLNDYLETDTWAREQAESYL